MKDYKVVGCLLFRDGDLVTHETVSFALVYVGCTCSVYLFRAFPTIARRSYSLADGGHARVVNTVPRPA